MNIKKVVVLGLMAVAMAGTSFAAPSISDVVAKQRYPWNGLVDIEYTTSGDATGWDAFIKMTDKTSGIVYYPKSFYGEILHTSSGKHRITWDTRADGLKNIEISRMEATVSLTQGVTNNLYMVVDLSGGFEAQSYPVTYLSSVPAGGWTDEHKTTKLVLRLVPPGTFMMGSPTDELGHDSKYETLHQVTLTKPFYIGVFELTQKQYSLVMGSNPSYYKGDVRPVEKVSYDTIRGTVNGSAWPSHNQVDANSFMGRLRSKVNMLFDLPTEAQWEYACRAGTSTALNSGKNVTGTETCSNMAEVGRYDGNTDDGKGGYSQHTKVGMYRENAWGLYDMHGNVSEWCLDWWVADLGTSAQIDPKGGASGSYRLVRGGCWYCGGNIYAGRPTACRSAYRYNYKFNSLGWTSPSNESRDWWGFRVCCLPAE